MNESRRIIVNKLKSTKLSNDWFFQCLIPHDSNYDNCEIYTRINFILSSLPSQYALACVHCSNCFVLSYPSRHVRQPKKSDCRYELPISRCSSACATHRFCESGNALQWTLIDPTAQSAPHAKGQEVSNSPKDTSVKLRLRLVSFSFFLWVKYTL